MVALVVALLLILALGLLPFSVSWFYGQRWHRRWRDQVQRRLLHVSHQNAAYDSEDETADYEGTIAASPQDLRYVEGVGYVIGDLSCRYNAISSQLRCAVNPQGPCSECSSYEPKFHLWVDLESD